MSSSEVGKDVVRFIMLTKRADAPLDFDFAKVVEASKDNPVFYVQYAHARIVVAQAQGGGRRDRPGAPRRTSTCSTRRSSALVKQAAQYPRVVESRGAGP